MRRHLLRLIGLALLATSSPACRRGEREIRLPRKPTEPWALYVDISPGQLEELLRSSDVLLVNVQVPHSEHIAGTDLNVPYDLIGANVDRFPAERDATIVLYCGNGEMSRLAAGELASLGYTSVYNLSGGLLAWKATGFAAEPGEGES